MATDDSVVSLNQAPLVTACPSVQSLQILAIKARIIRNLNDAGIVYYRNQDYTDSIQDAYDEIAARTGCIEKVATVPFVNNVTYYDFGTLISDYLAIKGIFSGRIKRWLIPTFSNELDTFRIDWECTINEPNYYFPVNFRWIAIFPKPAAISSVDNNMYVWYAAQADTLSLTSIPQLPPDSIISLEFYVTADLLDQSEEFAKADIFWALYEREVDALIKDVANRKYPDKTKILGG